MPSSERRSYTLSSSRDQPDTKEMPATYEDYVALPDDGRRYELVAGVLELLAPAPSPKHQGISTRITSTLMSRCDSEYVVLASPIDLILIFKFLNTGSLTPLMLPLNSTCSNTRARINWQACSKRKTPYNPTTSVASHLQWLKLSPGLRICPSNQLALS